MVSIRDTRSLVAPLGLPNPRPKTRRTKLGPNLLSKNSSVTISRRIGHSRDRPFTPAYGKRRRRRVQSGRQGPSRRIDILAKDRVGLPVVIELKVSRGHERTVGQALYYRSRIKQRFGVGKVSNSIVAANISQELRAAASEVPDVHLFEYSLAVNVTTITA